MAGAPGTGKSTLARGLAQHFGAAVFDLDVVKSACLQKGTSWSLSGAAAYESLYELTRDNLPHISVIVDAPSHYEILPKRLAAIASEAGAHHVFVECMCDDLHVVDTRLRARDRLRSQMPSVDGTPDDAPPYVNADGEPEQVHKRKTYRPSVNLLRVDTSLNEEAVCLIRQTAIRIQDLLVGLYVPPPEHRLEWLA